MTRLDQALALAQRGFWVFPVVENAKTPAVNDWPNAATRDATRITQWWTARDYNIGIATSRFGDDKALIVIDVDKKGEKDGETAILELELQGYELPVSLEQATPSAGRHVIYIADAPVRQGVDVLGRGVDVRSRGGYIVGPGSEIDGRAYAQINGHATLTAAPHWLIDRLGLAPVVDRHSGIVLPGVDRDRAGARARDYLLTAAPHAQQGNGGDQATFKVAANCKDFGCDEDQTRALMAEHWNEDCSPPWSDDELADKVAHAFRYGREPQGSAAPEAVFEAAPVSASNDDDELPPYAKFNDCYAFTTAGGGHIIWETTNSKGRSVIDHLDMQTFHTKHSADKLQTGDQTKAMTRLWLAWDGRRSYDGFVFAPERPIEARFYNLWRGFAVKPASTPDHPMVTRFIEHACQNVCGGDAKLTHWLLGYFAHMVQRPWEKPLTALVFKGKKGTGKNALVERIGKLIGPHFLLTSKRRYLVSNFNGHFENCLCLTLDEAFWSGDKESEGILKDLITGSEHVIEHKGKSTFTVDNLTRVVIIGNETWVVPASNDERRFAVFTMGEGRIQDRQYFHGLRVGLDEQGGNAHLLRYLLDFDLSTVDVNAAPHTQGLVDQKHASLEPVEEWWLECLRQEEIVGLDSGSAWPEKLPTNRLRDAFERWAKRRNIRSRLPVENQFGRSLGAVAPSMLRKKARADLGDATYSYVLPALVVLRRDWETFIGGAIEWEHV